MDSYTLPKLLRRVLEWDSSTSLPFRWRDSQLETLLNYVASVEIDSDFTSRVYGRLGVDEACCDDGFEPSADSVDVVLQELEELFKVPKLEQVSRTDKTLTQNEVIAGFITFLLQLLHPHPFCVALIRFPILESVVVKELRFIVNILGDTPFQATEHEQVLRILGEIERVANEAGTLVLPAVFGKRHLVVEAMNESLAALSQHITLLKVNIVEFLYLLPSVVVFPKASNAVDSLFIVDSVVCYIENLMNQIDDNEIVEFKDQIRVVHKWLTASQTLLKDMNLPLHLEVKELKETIMQIIDVAYEVEYLIEKDDVYLWYVTIRLTHVINSVSFIGTRLQELTTVYGIGALKVEDNVSARPSVKTMKDYQVDDIIVGFEDEENILEQLVRGRDQLQIISIVGMPGIGKTTLAKKLYNNSWVSYHFDIIIWCVVSQMHQRKNLLIDILISIESDHDKVEAMNMDEDSLSLKIYQHLKGKRYLLVMDDIWDSDVLEHFQRLVPSDGNGSRLLFTSRNKDVAPFGSIIHELPLLSNNLCWELLRKKVFPHKPCPTHLERIGKEIATKCHGLPLAVVVIAGVLSTMDTEENTWKNVGESLGSYMLSYQNNSVMQILELSYKHLPRHLKPCFLYLGLFAADRQYTPKILKWLWIAEGFIHKEDYKEAERVAEEYLIELIDKSLVIVTKKGSNGGPKACVIHNLVRDLCLRIAENGYFLKVGKQNDSIWSQKYHRLCICENDDTPVSVPYGQRFRTFFGSCGLPPMCIENMKLLRVLNCRTRFCQPYLHQLNVLVNLTFLAINRMPDSLYTLVNLEFLRVAEDGAHVSSRISELGKLKYLNLCNAIFADDCNSFQTNSIEYLSSIRILDQKSVDILKCSPNLRKLKCVCAQSWGENEVANLDLCSLTQLESLTVESWDKRVTWILFPSNIKKLHLGRLSLPWEKMSIVGALPNLEILKVGFFAFTGKRWETSDGEFRKLRFLKLSTPDLTHWNVSSSNHFPKLEQLVLEDCFDLIEIPSEIGEIASLQLISVNRYCRRPVKESARQIQQQQEQMSNEAFRVIVDQRSSGFTDDKEE